MKSNLSQHFFGFLIVIATWYLLATSFDLSFFIGHPIEVAKILFENTINFNFPYHALYTGSEALLGLLIGTVLGAFLGMLSWYKPVLYALFRPYVFIASVVPVFSFAPLIIIWFGISFSMKVALAAFASFIITYTEASYQSTELSQKEIKRIELMNANRFQILRFFVFPSILFRIILSAKKNVSNALLGVFIGEFLSSNKGIASEMIKAGALYQVSYVWAAAIYLVLLAFILLLMVSVVDKYRDKIISFVSVSKPIRSFSS